MKKQAIPISQCNCVAALQPVSGSKYDSGLEDIDKIKEAQGNFFENEGNNFYLIFSFDIDLILFLKKLLYILLHNFLLF